MQLFDNDRKMIYFTWKKGELGQCHVVDLFTGDVMVSQESGFNVKPHRSFVYKVSVLPTESPDHWRVISAGTDNGVAMWELDIANRALELESYNMMMGSTWFCLAEENSKDPNSSIFVGNMVGIISEWNTGPREHDSLEAQSSLPEPSEYLEIPEPYSDDKIVTTVLFDVIHFILMYGIWFLWGGLVMIIIVIVLVSVVIGRQSKKQS